MTDIGLYENVYYSKAKTQENAQNDLIQQTQENVDELVEILQNNVKIVLERDDKLNNLNDISRNLAECASDFEQYTVKIKRKQWWAHMKTKLVFAGLASILLIIVILLIIQHTT